MVHNTVLAIFKCTGVCCESFSLAFRQVFGMRLLECSQDDGRIGRFSVEKNRFIIEGSPGKKILDTILAVIEIDPAISLEVTETSNQFRELVFPLKSYGIHLMEHTSDKGAVSRVTLYDWHDLDIPVVSKKSIYQYSCDNVLKYKMDAISTPRAMLCLLNILEAHEETLDSLHACYEEGFCDLYMIDSFDDSDLAEAVIDTNVFFSDLDIIYANEESCADTWEEVIAAVGRFLTLPGVVKTTDGYVHMDVV